MLLQKVGGGVCYNRYVNICHILALIFEIRLCQSSIKIRGPFNTGPGFLYTFDKICNIYKGSKQHLFINFSTFILHCFSQLVY